MRSLPGNVHVPSASRVVHATAEELGGFKKLILRGSVVDLAVGVVQAAVKDLITQPFPRLPR